MATKKREQTPFQKLKMVQKRVEHYKDSNVPTVKQACQIRSINLALNFLERQADHTKEPITYEKYCKQHKISTSTLRKAIKELTSETSYKANPKSNNIQKYQKDKKFLFTKVALEGEESLTEEELNLFYKIKNSEKVKEEKIIQKKLEKEKDKDILTLTTNFSEAKITKNDINATNPPKTKELKNKNKGGSKEEPENLQNNEEENCNGDPTPTQGNLAFNRVQAIRDKNPNTYTQEEIETLQALALKKN